MRRGETCKEVFRLANYFSSHFHQYQFNGFTIPADEPCLALAMAVMNCRPLDVSEGGLAFAPSNKQIDLDITIPKAYYRRNKNQAYNVNLIHWSNYRTKLALYRFEIDKMYNVTRNLNKRGKLLYQYKWKYYFLCVFNVKAYWDRINSRIKRMFINKIL